MVLVVIVGTALDMTPTILILTPVLMPIVKQAGIDPIYFGVLFIINNSIGLITPPVGTVLNVVCGVAKIKMDDIIKGVWPFMIAQLHRACAADPVPDPGDGAGAMVQVVARNGRRRSGGADSRSRDAVAIQRGVNDDEEQHGSSVGGWLRGMLCVARRRAQAQVSEQTFRWTIAEPTDHPIVARRREVRRARRAEERRQDAGQGVPGGVLGSDVQELSAVQGGTIEMTSMNSRHPAGIVKEFAISTSRSCSTTRRKRTRCSTARSARRWSTSCRRTGWSRLAYWENGFRHVTNSKRPIKTAEDLDGPEDSRDARPRSTWRPSRRCDANPVPMAFGELYTALETKTVDAQENPLLDHRGQQVQRGAEVPHRHAPHLQHFIVLISKKIWDRLNKDEQKILLEAAGRRRSTSARCRVTRTRRRSRISRRRWSTPSCRRRSSRRSARS